jgi:putative FmdB family regulatory protein
MPTYDYQCDACGHEFELFQSINDPVKRKCPDCGKSKLRRLFGAGAAIVFKGSGFYQTDYRSESYKKSAKAEKEGSSAGGKETTAKSDAGGKDGGKADSAKKHASKPRKKQAE